MMCAWAHSSNWGMQTGEWNTRVVDTQRYTSLQSLDNEYRLSSHSHPSSYYLVRLYQCNIYYWSIERYKFKKNSSNMNWEGLRNYSLGLSLKTDETSKSSGSIWTILVSSLVSRQHILETRKAGRKLRQKYGNEQHTVWQLKHPLVGKATEGETQRRREVTVSDVR